MPIDNWRRSPCERSLTIESRRCSSPTSPAASRAFARRGPSRLDERNGNAWPVRMPSAAR